MASSSLAKFCFHCGGSSSGSLRNGWDLSTGKFAQLCDRCYSIYESGRFCETFHKKEEDWRECQFCSKERNFSNVLDLDEEIRRFQISKLRRPEIVPLFEKLLTTGDIDNSDGSIVIPKKHAEAYLPEVSDPHGILLHVIDDYGIEEWDARFRFWLNKMYILDDLREYMVSHKLQGGDTLIFSRLIPGGPYIIGFRKDSTKKPSRKASTRRGK